MVPSFRERASLPGTPWPQGGISTSKNGNGSSTDQNDNQAYSPLPPLPPRPPFLRAPRLPPLLPLAPMIICVFPPSIPALLPVLFLRLAATAPYSQWLLSFYICVLYIYIQHGGNPPLVLAPLILVTRRTSTIHHSHSLFASVGGPTRNDNHQGLLTMPERLGTKCPGARDARVGRFNCFLFNAKTLFCSATICWRVY